MPKIGEMLDGGLVTIESIDVVHYGPHQRR